jgi:hypothetical protein
MNQVYEKRLRLQFGAGLTSNEHAFGQLRSPPSGSTPSVSAFAAPSFKYVSTRSEVCRSEYSSFDMNEVALMTPSDQTQTSQFQRNTSETGEENPGKTAETDLSKYMNYSAHGLETSGNIYSDRFIPMRQGNNWDIKFAMGSEENVLQDNILPGVTPKKKKEVDSNREGVAYSCLLKNELLGTEIDDIKTQNGENVAITPMKCDNLFKFTSPKKKHFFTNEPVSPYSLYSITAKSQALLRSPRKPTRKISRIPFKVLDAPELQDDFYLNLVDWSSQNMLTVGLGSCVYLWSAHTSQVSRMCDIGINGNSVTSVSCSGKGNLVAVGTQLGFVQIYDVATSKLVTSMSGHTGRVGSVAWNGDLVTSGSRDRLILQKDIRVPTQIADRKLVGHRQEVCIITIILCKVIDAIYIFSLAKLFK